MKISHINTQSVRQVPVAFLKDCRGTRPTEETEEVTLSYDNGHRLLLWLFRGGIMSAKLIGSDGAEEHLINQTNAQLSQTVAQIVLTMTGGKIVKILTDSGRLHKSVLLELIYSEPLPVYQIESEDDTPPVTPTVVKFEELEPVNTFKELSEEELKQFEV